MRRKKRFTIKLVAIGFAVAAIGAPVAQAIPEGLDGSDSRAIRADGSQSVVSPDDRVMHGTHPQVIRSPDDRPIHGVTSVQPTQSVSASDDRGFELSNGVLSGLALALLAAMMIGFSVHHVRKAHRTASA
jgi:hypothetical protein